MIYWQHLHKYIDDVIYNNYQNGVNTSNSRAACKLKPTCKFDEGSLEKKKKHWEILRHNVNFH